MPRSLDDHNNHYILPGLSSPLELQLCRRGWISNTCGLLCRGQEHTSEWEPT